MDSVSQWVLRAGTATPVMSFGAKAVVAVSIVQKQFGTPSSTSLVLPLVARKPSDQPPSVFSPLAYFLLTSKLSLVSLVRFG